MKRFHSATIGTLSLLMMLLLLSACGQRVEYVQVVVTATPEAETAEESTAPLPPTDEAPEEETEPSADVGGGDDVSDEEVAEDTDEQGAVDTEIDDEGEATAEPASPAAPSDAFASAPDGSLAPPPASVGRLAFMGPYGDGSALHTFLSNADGSGLRFVSSDFAEGFFPSLSPDGTQVLLTANNEIGDPEVYVIDVASGEATNLTNRTGQDIQPVWSPDGEQIAFISEREGGDFDIWVMSADGSDPRRLAVTPGDDQLGSWSPDGSQIVFSNSDELGESLWLIDVASGETTRLTDGSEGVDSGPVWSPDGESIAFYSSPANGVPQVYTINPDGSERSAVTGGANPSVFPVWSPDGAWLAYTSVGAGNEFNVVAVDMETGSTHPIPDIKGLATSWRAVDELLADEGVQQGPSSSGVEVDPAVLEAAYRKGDPDAPVTIIEFSDYQCPFCQRWTSSTLPQLEPLIEDGTVQLIFVDFPLNIHPQAPAAAEAARCAGELGGSEAYWDMHDALFASLQQWSGQNSPAPIFAELASDIGLDGAELQSCVESGRYAAEVQAGLQEGIRLGVSGTPTFFVNGNRIVGAQPFEAFQPYLP